MFHTTAAGHDGDRQSKAAFGLTETKSVGSYAPDGYGLYNMSGKVHEQMSDWHDGEYYKVSLLIEPAGSAPRPDAYRLSHGGSFGDLQREVWLKGLEPLGPELIPGVSKFGDPWQSDGTGFLVVREIKTK